jgi:hypothetical protein
MQPLPELRDSHRNLPTHCAVSRGQTGGGLCPVHQRSGDMAAQQQDSPGHAILDPGVHTRARTSHVSCVRNFVGATPIYA